MTDPAPHHGTTHDLVPRGAVVGAVLAAGAGRRMGRAKATVSVGPQPLVRRAVTSLAGGGCAPVAVVLGAQAEEVRRLLDPEACEVLPNPGWDRGMASSVDVALRWADGLGAAAVVILPVDTPGIGPAVVRRLIAAWAETGMAAGAAVATYGGRPRNPVLLSADAVEEVRSVLYGDAGARRWLREHPDRTLTVECGDIGDPSDLDTPEDLIRWQAAAASAGSADHLSSRTPRPTHRPTHPAP